jgi:SAM-dependent methyltransferase
MVDVSANRLAGRLGCNCCGSTERSSLFSARDMMCGMPGEFSYFTCAQCGSIRLDNPPRELAPHYPATYHLRNRTIISKVTPELLRVYMELAPTGFLRQCIDWLAPERLPSTLSEMFSLRRGGIRETSLLDVGCGGGELLRNLYGLPFRELVGIDPFLPTSAASKGPRTRMYRATLEEWNNQHDFVVFNHSLEHIPSPFDALARVRELLQPGGVVLLRLPQVDSFAFRRYGPLWVQLDPPRHLWLPSLSGLRILARRAGFEIAEIKFDSNPLQLYGSEATTRLVREGSERSPGYRSELHYFRRLAWDPTSWVQARRLNQEGSGDQVACFLRQRQ